MHDTAGSLGPGWGGVGRLKNKITQRKVCRWLFSVLGCVPEALSPALRCLTLGVWMFSWISASGAARSDSEVEDELFSCVVKLFSHGEALFDELPKSTEMVSGTCAWVSRAGSAQETLCGPFSPHQPQGITLIRMDFLTKGLCFSCGQKKRKNQPCFSWILVKQTNPPNAGMKWTFVNK